MASNTRFPKGKVFLFFLITLHSSFSCLGLGNPSFLLLLFLLFVQEGTLEPSKTAHEFQVLVAKAAETLMEKVGVNKEVGLMEHTSIRFFDSNFLKATENNRKKR